MKNNNNHKIKFHIVSPKRMIILSLLSFGFYLVHWSYKNWKILQKEGNTKYKAYPILNSIFFGITSYYLFIEVRRHRKYHDDQEVSAGSTAWAVLFLNVIGLAFIPVIFMQRNMEAVNKYNTGDIGKSKKISWGEIIITIIGAVLFMTQVASAISQNSSDQYINPAQNEALRRYNNLTEKLEVCQNEVESLYSTVDTTNQTAIDSYNKLYNDCEAVRLQQNKAADDYNAYIQ